MESERSRGRQLVPSDTHRLTSPGPVPTRRRAAKELRNHRAMLQVPPSACDGSAAHSNTHFGRVCLLLLSKASRFAFLFSVLKVSWKNREISENLSESSSSHLIASSFGGGLLVE